MQKKRLKKIIEKLGIVKFLDKDVRDMRVLWLTNIPSPYRVKFFNEFGKYCDLTVLFEKRESDERDASWKNFQAEHFKAIYLKGKSIGVAEAFCPEVVKYLNCTYTHIIVTNFSDLTGMLAIATLKAKRIPYIIESDGGFAGSGRGIKEKLKKWLLSSARIYFSTAEEHDKYYLTYGAKREEIIRYPFTSLHETDILPKPVTEEEKLALCKKLGMEEEKIILSVGQFIYRKGYDILFKALCKLDPSIGCYIIGGKPTDEYAQMIKKFNLSNVHFVDFKLKDELNEYYRAADLFVLPTREDIWGLVINEAMAQGLPVVTTDRCVAGLELIQDTICGQVVPTEDSEALANAIRNELKNLSLERSYQILTKVKQYTVEEMACVHIKHLEKEYRQSDKKK